VRYVIPFLNQFWLFATPIAYPSDIVPPAYRPLLGLNPMAGVVEGFRWALLGTEPEPGLLLLTSSLVAILMCATGLAYFARVEHRFADVI
jgi:lipopolysaccharide transport system permease protein